MNLKVRRWRRKGFRVHNYFKHLRPGHKLLLIAIVCVATFAVLKRLWRPTSPTKMATVHMDAVNIFVDEPVCRIISWEPPDLIAFQTSKCSYSSCEPYATLTQVNDTTSVIRLNSNSRLCGETACCAAVYSMPQRNYDEFRYPPRGCRKLKQLQKIHPSVFTEVLETACEDLCDNKRIVNFHPLFPLTTTVQRKINAWKSYDNLLAATAVRVIILVVRNMTIGTAQRMMPFTTDAVADFYPMLGFTMVESSPTGNLLAALTGLNFSQLNSSCSLKTLGIFDSCPFLWKEFRNLDFITAYVDQFRLKETQGSPAVMLNSDIDFLAQPTDYYIPSAFINEKMTPTQTESQLYNSFASSSPEDFILDSVQSFVQKFQDVPFIGVFQLSPAGLARASRIDKKLASILSTLKGSQNVLTIFASTLEGNSPKTSRPFLYISVPPSFESHIENLRLNSRRLTTIFDIYQTIRQVAIHACHVLSLEEPDCFSSTLSSTNGGISLIHEIPSDRTCASAQVPLDMCPC